MRRLIAAVILSPLFSVAAMAGEAAPPQQPMSFFVTSKNPGDGGNLGGLAGADKHCQTLAAAAGAGNKTWRAYLSTQGPGAVNARDRIGKGPWYNVKGTRIAADLADLHGDTLDLARKGNMINRRSAFTETGGIISGGEDGRPNQHDMLTGTQMDGTAFSGDEDRTCRNWTSNKDGRAQVGHHDRASGSNISWNSAHQTRDCTGEGFVTTGGAGLFYCFAID